MAISKEDMAQLLTDFGTQATAEIKKQVDALDVNLNTKYADMQAGLISQKDFSDFKESQVAQINATIKRLEDLTLASKAQGDEIAKLLGSHTAAPKTMTEFLKPFVPKMMEFKQAGTGYFEITGEQMKAAGVTSIGGSTPSVASNPYLPGIAGTPLEMFDIIRNDNFMITRVDMGTTDQYKLAWVNETGYEGEPNTNIAESGYKPLVQHKFSVEISTAKKAAAYSILTEEFENDVPALASEVRGMLQNDVIRSFDDSIQTDVFNAAKPYSIPGLNNEVYQAGYWDAAYALWSQPGVYNFTPNTIAWNWTTNAKVQMSKNNNGTYLLPPFKDELINALVKANKITTNVAIAGDLRQYRVRMYKDYTLRVGWINDQFIKNEFCILGELRYHSFISDNRKWAIAKGDLNNIQDIINGTPGS